MAKNVQRESKFPGLMQDLTPQPTSTHTHTDTHEHTHTPTMRDRKTRRVQLLMKESTVDALDAYVKKYDTSRSDIIQNLVEDFIKKNV